MARHGHAANRARSPALCRFVTKLLAWPGQPGYSMGVNQGTHPMTAKNILAVYNLATKAELHEGRCWYSDAKILATALADQYGVSVRTAVGVIAALSPRNKWRRNLLDAEALLKVAQVDLKAAAEVKVCTFGANRAKALAIIAADCESDEALFSILKGAKLVEFAKCILGYSDEVCIDGHAYSIWLGDRVALKNVPNITKKMREQIKADYCRAAELLNAPAYEVQAVTWCAWRRLHLSPHHI